MRKALRTIVFLYFLGGAISGFLLYYSYVWGALFGVPELNLLQRFWALLIVQPIALFFAVVRYLLWLPSLVHWGFFGTESFVDWLMPGFGIDMIRQPT